MTPRRALPILLALLLSSVPRAAPAATVDGALRARARAEGEVAVLVATTPGAGRQATGRRMACA
ncbi:MAG: hypothetical protein U0802_04445 [Candidatus Binatia bacterium]